MYRRPILLTFIVLLFFRAASAQQMDIQNYRTYNGTGNNLAFPEWGAAGENLLRVTDIGYADQVSAPGGVDRANPRVISNELFAQDGPINDRMRLSDYCWAFGQFIDHDIGLTPEGPEPMFIEVPAGDPWFDPFSSGQAIIPMHRNITDPSTGTGPENPRQHPNIITAFLDGSGVYGSSEERALWLRTMEGGKLKTSQGNMPPFNTMSGEFDAPLDPRAPVMDNPVGLSDKFFVAGDVRANENPLLLSIHTIFLREHNRLCDELAAAHPDWTDEQLYQHARKMVGGMIQAIAFNEWLPVMGVELKPYSGYRPDVNPQLMNVFSAAAYRLGHTLLNGTLRRLDKDGEVLEIGHLSLRDAFFNPFVVEETGGIEPFLQGMAVQTQQGMDAKVIDDVRNFLFGPPGAGGLDLASININRGRERGLPDFNTVRRNFGLQPYYFLNQINVNIQIAAALGKLYGNVHNIDPWVGMLAEMPMQDALFGPTIMTIMKHQFSALRDGDRFFYLNDPVLSEKEKKDIHATTMHDVIMRNTDIVLMQDEVFRSMPFSHICENVLVELSGAVRTEPGEPLSGVEVTLKHGESIESFQTGLDGAFNFLPVGGCEVEALELAKDGEARAGVSTIDLIIIQKHVLNVKPLPSPYKMIAADVNNSGNISTLDIVALRKVILGVDQEFPNNKVWRFIPADYEFADPSNPFEAGFPEGLNFNTLARDLDMVFIAVKTGDVNSSFMPRNQFAEPVVENRDAAPGLDLYIADQPLVTGETVAATFTAAELSNLLGYQFSLSYDRQALRFESLEAGSIPQMGSDNFGIFEEDGVITTSWNTSAPVSLKGGEPLFALRFRAQRNGRLREMLRLGDAMTADAYDESLHTMPVRLLFDQEAGVSTDFAVYQNQPNPFRTQTAISFFLPEAGPATLTVFDVTGRVLHSQSGHFAQGSHQWLLQRSELPGSGFLYYRVESGKDAATRKMLLIE
jgi:hypothetical protein